MSTNQSQSRRAFLGAVGVVAAAQVAAHGQANGASVVVHHDSGETIPLWKVVIGEGDGQSVLDYTPSAEQARGQVAEYSDTPNKCAAKKAEGRFSGRVFRMATCTWNGYRHRIVSLAEFRKDNCARLDKSERAEAARIAGGDRKRVERDVKAYEQDRREWLYGSEPCHELDVPEFVVLNEDQLEPGDYHADRAGALQAAAAWNRGRLADFRGWEAGNHWAIVLEVGESLPDTMGTQCGTAFAGDIAVETITTQRPVRLVRPTAAEIARHAGAAV